MLSFYQHLPERISPIVFSVGFFSVRWYSLMYLAAFLVTYALLRWRFVRDINGSKFSISRIQNFLFDWMTYSVAGLLIGGRLGYVLFYNFNYYWHNPLAIVSPYDFSIGVWTGIFGVSYFGGALGIVLAGWIWTRRNKINFWDWADFVIPAIPAGYFFGRLGNFLNGELYGRTTEKAWGMYFPVDFGLALRHPSQLYEAFFEGLVLFVILWLGRNKIKFSGQLVVIYFLGYGLFRFGIEFFREPDKSVDLFLGFLTLGQIFSFGFIALALILGGALFKSKKAL